MPAGFSLIEVLISLVLISLVLLGFDVMQLYSLEKNRDAYYLSAAQNQLASFANQLRNLNSSTDLKKQISLWNRQNKEILPLGKGSVTGAYPEYTETLQWGEKNPSNSLSLVVIV